MNRFRPCIVLLASSLLLPCLTGCGRTIESKAEHAIGDLLPRYLGPADKYTTHVSGRTGAMMRGRLSSVHIEGINVRLLPDLAVSRLLLDLSDISLDRGKGTLQKVGSARFSARLDEAAVNRYAISRRPNIPELKVTLDADGQVTVSSRPELLGVPTVPVSVRGTVRLEGDGQHLDFYPDAAQVRIGVTLGTALPGFVADKIAEQINPFADLTPAPIPVIAQTVRVERGALTLTGTVPPDAIARLANTP